MDCLPNPELQAICTSALSQAKATLLHFEAISDQWTPYKAKNKDIVTAKLKSPSGLNIMRADCVIYAPLETVAAVVYAMEENTKWDPVLETTEQIAFFPDCKVLRNTYWAPFPVTKRDFVLTLKLFREADCIIDASASIETPLCPEVKGFVRGHLHYGGFVLRAMSPMVTRAVHVVYADPRGKLPHFLVNMGQKKHYQYLEAVKNYLESLPEQLVL